MEIKLYNTLTNRAERFNPIEPGVVSMYNCGPTVYDYAHIGNFRTFLMADLLRRMFEFLGYRVEQVMNLTDVGHMTEDDQIDGGGQDRMEVGARRLREAKKQGRADVDNPDDPGQVAEYFIDAFIRDAQRLGMRVAHEPDHLPRATANINAMIDLIRQLIANNHAYVTDEGAVYYDITSFPDYGRLSGNTLTQLQAGAGGRVQDTHQKGKRHPPDFLLWKHDEKHLMKWDSPWGVGYPGWHIECSAMAMGVLGRPTIDIHTGGEDNIFPHHECEIAQSTGATGQPFARYWIHARHLLVEGQKMSKSKGNFFTLRDLLARGAAPEAVRFALLRAPYRSNANFTLKGLEEADRFVRRLRAIGGDDAPDTAIQPGEKLRMGDSAIERDFAAAVADDLNISAALGELSKWMGTVQPGDPEACAVLRRIDTVLGVLSPRGADEADLTPAGLDDEKINDLCRQIDEARATKDYARSDAIREELAAAGIEVQITREGTKWRRKLQ
jgi:cysteinyl-tRNA synthetase